MTELPSPSQVPRKESETQFRKLHQEVSKNARLHSLGLAVAEIVEEGGDYLVKRWIDGLRGDHWFIQWNEKGRPLDDAGWLGLCAMFDKLSAKGVYVQNLKDLNLIWDGRKWVVIDVGYFKTGLTPQQALGRYYDTFDGRWNKARYSRSRFMFLCPPIATIRGHGPDDYVKRDRPRTFYKKKNSKSMTLNGEGNGNHENGCPDHGDGLRQGQSSEALNEIKRKQAEAAFAMLEETKNQRRRKKKTAKVQGKPKEEKARKSTVGDEKKKKKAKHSAADGEKKEEKARITTDLEEAKKEVKPKKSKSEVDEKAKQRKERKQEERRKDGGEGKKDKQKKKEKELKIGP